MRTHNQASVQSHGDQLTRVMEEDFFVGSGEIPKIPWTEAVRTTTASSVAPGPPSANFNFPQPAKKRLKPPRKLAVKLERVGSSESNSSLESKSREEVGNLSNGDIMARQTTDLTSITAAAARYFEMLFMCLQNKIKCLLF